MRTKTSSEAVSDYRRNRKLNLLAACGNKCCLCGYDKAVAALEFHHIDATQKEFGIGSNGNCHNIQKDIAEIRKCILVCSNCHREVHSGLFSDEELYQKQFFDEDFISFLLAPPKKEQEFTCTECGKNIRYDNKSGLCQSCARLKTRVVERPTRELLKSLIREHTFCDLGRRFNVSDNTIRKWCDGYDLPRTKKEIQAFSDEEWQLI